MKRTKLKDRILPKYTKGEEIFNMVSHIVGGVAGIATIVLCSVFAGIRHNTYGVVSGVIFGVSMLFLYTMSSIYHGLKPDTKAKKVFQVLDHCSIFLLIAGSYTPFALCTLREMDTATGWWIFGIIWGMAILGIILIVTKIKKSNEYIPFGPFIVIATFISIFVPFDILLKTLLVIFTLGTYKAV